MKQYLVCIQSHLWNNSDYSEYANYYTDQATLEDAYEYAKKCINNWNQESKNGVVYYLYDIYEVTPINY